MKTICSNLIWWLAVNAVYAVAAVAALPVYLFLLATRRKYRHRPWERWGLAPKFAPGRRRFWVHAISVGEVEAARTFVPALAKAFPEAEIVLSTTTMTGRERAAKLFPGRPLLYFPLDLAPCVALALWRVRPTAVIQVESEWWPNFFLTAALAGVPVLAVNVRMTEKSHRQYGKIRGLMRTIINSCRAVGLQSELYRERLAGLGADPSRLHVTGQMKHDCVTFADTVPGADALARDMHIDPGVPVLVAGSIGPGEEDILLAAYREARKIDPRLRLVLVPRRPENFDAAAAAVGKACFPLVRRSAGPAPKPIMGSPPVILGDTMGEMMKWYALADFVFVGRSLVSLGGSNPMEAGSLGKALVWGPHMFNFAEEAPAFIEAGAARTAADVPGLAAVFIELLTRPERRRQMGEAARDTIRRMQGATARNIDLVRRALNDEGTP